MSKLDDYRAEIDAIDKELTELFERRMGVVLKVAQYKRDNNISVLQNNREEEVLNKAVKNLKDKSYAKEVKEFLNATMEISRGLQHRRIDGIQNIKEIDIKDEKINYNAKIGYQGVNGSFSEEALLDYFGEDSNALAYKYFEDVFKALESEEIQYGVLPIENSSTGAIAEIYDLIRKYGFYIVGEQCVKVDQHLLGIKGTKLEDIKEVYSHVQGLKQSSDFLNKNTNWTLIPHNNTAASAKLVRDLGDKSKVAIASSRAAKFYGLEILEKCINTAKDNYTRFVIIAKEMNVTKDADKVSVVFSLEHKVGTLYNLLRYFADNNINMVKIESRPMKETSWRYFLYVDFQGTIYSESAKNALAYIENEAAYFRVLGAYKNKLDL